jgi:hypothetical protein
MRNIKTILQKLIQLFSKGGKTVKNARVIPKNTKYAEQLKRIANWERTDREMWEWWNRKLPQEKVRDLKLIKQGKLTPEELERRWKAELNTLPKTKQMRVVQGIPFFEWELDEINRITDKLVKYLEKPAKDTIVITTKEFSVSSKAVSRVTRQSKTGQKYVKTTADKNPWIDKWNGQGQTVTIHLIPFYKAKQLRPNLTWSTNGWAKGTDIYLVWENFSLKTFKHNYDAMQSNLKRVLTHEIAHVKDPAIVRSSKLNLRSRYNPNAEYIADPTVALAKNAPQNWMKHYYYNQKEIVANLAPVLTSITDNTSKIVKQIGKKRTTAALNELQQWLATGTGPISNLSNDSRKILGYTSWYQKLFRARPESPHVLFKQPVEDQITGFFNTFKTQNPAEYKKMINKMSRQVENLKVQVHWTRNLTPESVIKYKTILES